MNFQKFRQTSWYRLASYSAYIGEILCYAVYKAFAGTNGALLGMFIFIPLFWVSISLPLWIFVIGQLRVVSSKNPDSMIRPGTNIIHDISLIIWLVIIIFIAILIILDSVSGIMDI